MSEPDRYDEHAKLLADHCRFCDRLNDNYKCTDDYAASVLAIAAALREQGAEIAEQKEALAYQARLIVVGLTRQTELQAEIAKLKSQLAVPLDDRGKTHYENCWRDRGHHACAIAKIAELDFELTGMMEKKP